MSLLSPRRRCAAALLCLLCAGPLTARADEPSAAAAEAMTTLKRLMQVKVVSASRRQQALPTAPANITVVTAEMIARRGYRNLIEVLEDVPGFDFATYEDGGGEYPLHALHRGIGGDPGMTKLLVLVDGIVQNHIAFNWAQGLGNEQILHDVERVEIIHGPGSALYGASALTGIVHVVTRQGVDETSVELGLGPDNTRDVELLHGGEAKGLAYQVAFRAYLSDGDGGLGRPDPGRFFRDLVEPSRLEQNYDADGDYVLDGPNPGAGRVLPAGFNTEKRDWAVRAKAARGPTELGVSAWDRRDGLGSYVVGYEYRTARDDFLTHQSGFHAYGRHAAKLARGRLDLQSLVWYRVNQQEPDTGFQYTYRFFDRKKSYHSHSSQFAIEEQLSGRPAEGHNLTVGARFLANSKMDQVISLGRLQEGSSSFTDSSWDVANAGGGLGQAANARTFQEQEFALYGVLDGELHPMVRYSAGGRWDYGTDYGHVFNPRLTLMLEPRDPWLVKLSYGTAFRQPTSFELFDEFRGSPGLEPERVRTVELESDLTWERDAATFESTRFQVNAFYSRLSDTIATVPDLTRAGGERFDNIARSHVRGISFELLTQPVRHLLVGVNHIYLEGRPAGGDWSDIAHVAAHKLNGVVNLRLLDDLVNVNLRVNHVGRRKVPATNTFFDRHAPGYTKANLALTLRKRFGRHLLEPQLLVSNLFDEAYFGVGRQAGSGDRDVYDPDSNVNPTGFIPPYHPQPGRRVFFDVRYRF